MVTKMEGAGDDDVDTLVPDPQVWRELGITSMTGWALVARRYAQFPASDSISRSQLSELPPARRFQGATLEAGDCYTQRRGGVSVTSVTG